MYQSAVDRVLRAEQPGAAPTTPTVAVIGGGFCGTMAVVHLLRQHQGPALRILWVDRRGAFARGLAYASRSLSHMLNVPASNMSALPDDPLHFLTWLERRFSHVRADTYAHRTLYGTYLAELLDHTIAAAGGMHTARLEIDQRADEVIDLRIDPASKRVKLTLLDQGATYADRVLLATGHAPPAELPIRNRSFYASPLYRADPWSPGALEHLSLTDHVLFIGTGLTMVDLALTLEDRGHQGMIYALSRHGRLPATHDCAAVQTQLLEPGETLPTRLRALVAFVRRKAEAASSVRPDGWQSVIDGLRPMIPALWNGWTEDERRAFLRHVRPTWERLRHRMPRAVADRISNLSRSGRLQLIQGRLEDIHEHLGRADVRFRHGDRVARLSVRRVVSCTGPEWDLRRHRSALVRSLLARGLVRPDPLRLGAETDRHGALIDGTGVPSSVLFTIGTWRKPTLWESTAVPELRHQAQDVVYRLLEGLDAVSARRLPPTAAPRSATVDAAGARR